MAPARFSITASHLFKSAAPWSCGECAGGRAVLLVVAGCSGSKDAGGGYEVGVAVGAAAVGQVEGVFEADAGVEASADGVFDEDPGQLPVAVLQPGRFDVGAVEDLVDGVHHGYCVILAPLSLSGFDEHPGDPVGQAAGDERLGVQIGRAHV